MKSLHLASNPPIAMESSSILETLRSDANYSTYSKHSSMRADVEASLRGIMRYIESNCRPKLSRKKSRSISKNNTPEYSE